MSLMPPSARTDAGKSQRVAELADALENVQAARPIAMQVLQLADDPDADARKVAACIEQDPILVAQVLRLANSAAFGMARQVKTTQIAVAILGFSTIRSMAILVASGLRNLKHPAPAGFWEHSAATAAACSVISRQFGVSPGDGFAIGLIHDIGIPMLNTVDPVAFAGISSVDDAAACELEADLFGLSHAEAAAMVLSNWSFPESLVGAIGSHHLDAPLETNESRLLFAGDAIAHLASDDGSKADRRRLRSLGFEKSEIDRLVGDVGGRSGGILASLLR
jgi:HD-like signal output (HDOD) protein